MLTDSSYLKEKLKEYEFKFNEEQIEKVLSFIDYLIEENKKYNLTGIKEGNEIVCKHIIDSLLLLKSYSFKTGDKILNIGAGGGFPSIPIAIFREDLDIYQLEASNKKVNFLDNVNEKVGLHNIFNIRGRAEEVAKDSRYRECFDFVTARAVARLKVLAELTIPYLKVGGYFLPMKGDMQGDELNEAMEMIGILGGEIIDRQKYKLPNDDKREILIIKKISQTPSKYPRIYKKIIGNK